MLALELELKEEYERQSGTIKTDEVNERKHRVGNRKLLLTYSTLQVLKEPVQDDTSHQRRRQIHLYID